MEVGIENVLDIIRVGGDNGSACAEALEDDGLRGGVR